MNESVENTGNIEVDLTEQPVNPPRNAEESYKRLEERLAVIPEDEIVSPKQPLHVISTEATEVAIAAVEDRETLIGYGADESMIDSLPVRAACFSYAAAKYQISFGDDPDVRKEFEELFPQALKTREYLERFCRHGYRRNPGQLAKLGKIAEGRGHSDTVFDLLPIRLLIESNPEPLKAMRAFKWEMVDEAEELYEKLSRVYARSKIDPHKIDTARDMLDRAYTYLKQAMDEIKEIGQFAFEGTERYQAYVSEFYRQAGLAAARARREKAEQDGPSAM